MPPNREVNKDVMERVDVMREINLIDMKVNYMVFISSTNRPHPERFTVIASY